MNNTLPSGRPQLFALAEDMADGLHDHGAAVDIKQNTEPVFRADLDAARTEALFTALSGAGHRLLPHHAGDDPRQTVNPPGPPAVPLKWSAGLCQKSARSRKQLCSSLVQK